MKRIDCGEWLRAEIGDDAIAKVIVGPVGAMPTTDARGHAEMATLRPRLAGDPGVRAILVRSEGKGFNAGGRTELVQEMLASEAARLHVLREARDLVQAMIDCDLQIVSAIDGAAVGSDAEARERLAALTEKRAPRFQQSP